MDADSESRLSEADCSSSSEEVGDATESEFDDSDDSDVAGDAGEASPDSGEASRGAGAGSASRSAGSGEASRRGGAGEAARAAAVAARVVRFTTGGAYASSKGSSSGFAEISSAAR